MRFIYIIFERIKSHLKNHTTVTVLFMMGVFASTLFFAYYYGDNVKSTMADKDPELMAEYEIYSGDGFSYDDVRFDDLEKDGTVTLVFDFELDKSRSSDIFVGSNSGRVSIPCMARRTDEFPYEARWGIVDPKENTEGIVLSYGMGGDFEISKDKIKKAEDPYMCISGVIMPVSGVYNRGGRNIIPFEFVKKHGLKANTISFSYDKPLSEDAANKFAAKLKEKFPEANSVSTSFERYREILDYEEGTMFFRMQRAMLLMLLSVFTFMFLAKYLFDMSAREDVIYRMIGMQRADIALISFGEIAILSLVAIIAALIFHAALFKQVFGAVSKIAAIKFTFADYLAVGSGALLTCLAACVPFVFIVWRKTPNEAKTYTE